MNRVFRERYRAMTGCYLGVYLRRAHELPVDNYSQSLTNISGCNGSPFFGIRKSKRNLKTAVTGRDIAYLGHFYFFRQQGFIVISDQPYGTFGTRNSPTNSYISTMRHIFQERIYPRRVGNSVAIIRSNANGRVVKLHHFIDSYVPFDTIYSFGFRCTRISTGSSCNQNSNAYK